MANVQLFTDPTGLIDDSAVNDQNLSNIIDELNIQTNQLNAIYQQPTIVASGVLDFDPNLAVDKGATVYLRYVNTKTVNHNLGYVPLCFATHDYGSDAGADSRGNYVPYYQNDYDALDDINANTKLSMIIDLAPGKQNITVTISSSSRDFNVDSNFHYVYYYITNTPEFIS